MRSRCASRSRLFGRYQHPPLRDQRSRYALKMSALPSPFRPPVPDDAGDDRGGRRNGRGEHEGLVVDLVLVEPEPYEGDDGEGDEAEHNGAGEPADRLAGPVVEEADQVGQPLADRGCGESDRAGEDQRHDGARPYLLAEHPDEYTGDEAGQSDGDGHAAEEPAGGVRHGWLLRWGRGSLHGGGDQVAGVADVVGQQPIRVDALAGG
jgi:hypothetical protein